MANRKQEGCDMGETNRVGGGEARATSLRALFKSKGETLNQRIIWLGLCFRKFFLTGIMEAQISEKKKKNKDEDFYSRMWKVNSLILDTFSGFTICPKGEVYCASCPLVIFFWETLIVFSGCLELMRQMSSIKEQFKNMLLISMSSVNELI